MRNQQGNTAVKEAEKTERISIAKSKLLEGAITAISVDTCIFSAKQNRLADGVFRHLEQFNGNTFRLVFSEVTIKEVFAHIAKNAEEARVKLVSSLRDAGKFWRLRADHKSLAEELLNAESPRALAAKQVKDFAVRCGAEIVEAKSTVDLSVLLKRYFDVQAPFEAAGDKKSEFPDAIALFSLEAWAAKNDTSIVFVTKDKGCARFCDQSTRLFAIDDLTEALKLVQERDKHCAELCHSLEAAIVGGKYPDLIVQIEEAIAQDIWEIDWIPEADAAFYYDAEMQDAALINAKFSGFGVQPIFRAVEFCVDKLVVQAEIEITVEAACNFSFSVKDGIDHDMVSVGGVEANATDTVHVDVLLTFKNPHDDGPEVAEIELVPARRTFYFGTVWPDYSDEDPNDEYY